MSGHQYCRKCRKKNPYPICNKCVDKSKIPCSKCGQPTPSITVYGKQPKRTTCLACTASDTADIRSTGVICKVCGNKNDSTSTFYQVCYECKLIVTQCPQCEKDMPKYIKRGNLRKYCSNRCRSLANPMTLKQRRKAQKTKWKDHEYKTHENRLARDKPEYDEWRVAVFKRDNYTCQDCENNGGELHPHHIKPFATHEKLRYVVSNGITLCKSCHRKRHKHTFIGKTKIQSS